MKKLMVIDGNSIINRAFYGIRLLSNSEGVYTNALLGFLNILSRLRDEEEPDGVCVCFDLKAPTFRHKMYDGYKAGRHATPEDLISQFPDTKECLTLMGLHVLELPGYEADDIQGTVAKMAHALPDTEAYILSGDRDLLQLIDDKVT
ncbi:MAG: DNA polymerase I, partial [Clostridia bacterium]|nr:DNA polymerase I [Clostridia bacterium]